MAASLATTESQRSRLRELFNLVGGLDRDGEDYLMVREAQHLVEDLRKDLAA